MIQLARILEFDIYKAGYGIAKPAIVEFDVALSEVQRDAVQKIKNGVANRAEFVRILNQSTSAGDKEPLEILIDRIEVVAPYFVHIPLYGAWWGFACASDSLDPRAVSPEEADRRVAARGLRDLQFYNGEMHRAIFAQPNYVRALLA